MKQEMETIINKNRPQVGSGPSNSDSPSDNVNSSITSSPTDTLRALKNSAAKIINNLTPIFAKIRKFKNNDFYFDYSKGWHGVLVGLRKLLQLDYAGGSNYANYKTPEGILSLRLADHNANGNNFNSEHTNISVYVALIEYPHIPSKVEYTEYKIEPGTYNADPAGVIFSIVCAVEKALKGEVFDLEKKIAHKASYIIEIKEQKQSL